MATQRSPPAHSPADGLQGGPGDHVALPAGVFVFIGQDPNTGFLNHSGVQLDDWGYIVTGHALVHDAEGLPFEDGIFDAVISECIFCTFVDKGGAAARMRRVLKPGGRLGLSDMAASGPLPDDIQSLLAWAACVAGAGTPQDYVTTLQAAGFSGFQIEDQRDALLDMMADVRRKLLGVELAVGLGKLDLGDVDLAEGKRLARQAVELIEGGVVGYTVITARSALIDSA